MKIYIKMNQTRSHFTMFLFTSRKNVKKDWLMNSVYYSSVAINWKRRMANPHSWLVRSMPNLNRTDLGPCPIELFGNKFCFWKNHIYLKCAFQKGLWTKIAWGRWRSNVTWLENVVNVFSVVWEYFDVSWLTVDLETYNCQQR